MRHSSRTRILGDHTLRETQASLNYDEAAARKGFPLLLRYVTIPNTKTTTFHGDDPRVGLPDSLWSQHFTPFKQRSGDGEEVEEVELGGRNMASAIIERNNKWKES